MATRTKTRRRRAPSRRKRNPYRVKVSANPKRRRRSYAPKRRRRRRARRNPLVPTGLFRRGLAVAAGFIMAPRLTNMIPFELPGGRVGAYAKEFIVISIGSQLVGKALGRRYGNALFAGGVIHIAVDMLQSYVPAFGNGMGYYFPPDAQLALGAGTDVGTFGAPPEMFQSGEVERYRSRFH